MNCKGKENEDFGVTSDEEDKIKERERANEERERAAESLNREQRKKKLEDVCVKCKKQLLEAGDGHKLNWRYTSSTNFLASIYFLFLSVNYIPQTWRKTVFRTTCT